jgi:hypothetical protein
MRREHPDPNHESVTMNLHNETAPGVAWSEPLTYALNIVPGLELVGLARVASVRT